MAEKFIETHGRERTTPTENPPAGYRSLYAKADGWYDKDDAGVETKISNPIAGTDTAKEFRVVLTGSNGAVATTAVTKNTLSAAPAIAYAAEGVVTVTLASEFVVARTIPIVSLGTATGGVIIKAEVTSANVITINSFLVTDGTTAADFIGTVFLSIIVDPA